MPLEDYAKKRDLSKTPEPSPKKETGSEEKAPIFVVQEHHATRLHWDFRLETGGVLKSWAVPKEPPLLPGTKRLAVAVEDHPLEYAKFEGIIPTGQYGAGTVKIWDSGTYVLEKMSEKEIAVDLRGKKMKGKYVLVKTQFRGSEKSWLLFKKLAQG